MSHQPIIFDVVDIINIILDYLPDIRVITVNKFLLRIVHKHQDYKIYWSIYDSSIGNLCQHGLPKMLPLIDITPDNLAGLVIAYLTRLAIVYQRYQEDFPIRNMSDQGLLNTINYLHEHGGEIQCVENNNENDD